MYGNPSRFNVARTAADSRKLDPMAEAAKAPTHTAEAHTAEDRRQILKRLGRFAAVTPPAVTLLLAAMEKPAKAKVLSPIVY